MLISVHLPKTAGNSFLSTLISYYGQALYQDYGDRPINTTSLSRNMHALLASAFHGLASHRWSGIDCIHGHFMPLKYRFLRTQQSKQYVIWLRDPVERMASHYYYWKRHYNPDDAGKLHHRVVQEDWSLERFCLGPELQNIYSKFLWGFSLSDFDFIGITEYFDEDLAQFSNRYLQAGMSPQAINVNPDQQKKSYIEDASFRRQIEHFHQKDMDIYKRANELREQRASTDPGRPIS